MKFKMPKIKFSKKETIRYLKKNWRFVSIISGTIVSTIILGVTASLVAKQKSRFIATTSEFKTDKVTEGSIINAAQVLTLNDFNFSINPDKFNLSEVSSGDFVFPNPIETNHISRQNTAIEYWTDQLLIKKVGDTDKDFFLRSNNNAPLNIFKNDYDISIKSFSNEKEGILFLKVDLKPKTTVAKVLTEQSKTYELKGFKKATNFQSRLNNVLLNTLFLKSSFTSFNSYDEIKTEYEKLSADKISSFITDRIDFSIEERLGSIDKNSIALEFLDVDKKIRLKYRVKINTYDATADNLMQRTAVDVSDSQNLSIDISLNIFKIKSIISTLHFRPTNNRTLSELSEGDITYNSFTQSYRNVELFSTDASVNLNDYVITFNNTSTAPGAVDKDNLVFNFSIMNREDRRQGVTYFLTGQITIPKSNLKSE